MAFSSSVDDGAKEESCDWSTGGEEDAVVFDSARFVRFLDKVNGCEGVEVSRQHTLPIE